MRELITALETHIQYSQHGENEENILKHYQLLWLVKLVNRFLMSISRLNMKLSEVEPDQDIISEFCQVVSKIVNIV